MATLHQLDRSNSVTGHVEEIAKLVDDAWVRRRKNLGPRIGQRVHGILNRTHGTVEAAGDRGSNSCHVADRSRHYGWIFNLSSLWLEILKSRALSGRC